MDSYDISSILEWLVNGDPGAQPVLAPVDALTLAMGVFALVGAALLVMTQISKAKRNARAARLAAEERQSSRFRRI